MPKTLDISIKIYTLNIYDCPTCGEVLEDQVYFDGDETSLCLICDSPVSARTVPIAGLNIPVQRKVSRKRYLEARGTYSDESNLE